MSASSVPDPDPSAARRTAERELRALARRRHHHRDKLSEITKATKPLVFQLDKLGVERTQIAELAGLTRRTVYDILKAGSRPEHDRDERAHPE